MEALCSYLPASILSFLLEQQGKAIAPPTRQSYKTAVLFADISGYTALCEAVASKGAGGDEYLARHLNSYFEQLVRIMSSQGGDVFKFAGDAVIVLWPPSPTASAEEIEDLTLVARRAAQCGLEIKRGLQDVNLAPGITLSVKIGVGVGEVSILHVGGVFGRMEYVATGAPLLQAFGAEHHCKVPDVVVSPEAWKLISPHFEAEINDGHAYLKKNVAPLKKVNVSRAISHAMAGGAAGSGSIRSVDSSVRAEVLRQVGKYVPSAVIPFINHHEEKWASELRRICVLFVNLGMKETDMNEVATNKEYISVIHEVLSAVQTAVYKYEGSLNKFLMDDKGSTLIAVFGLPPLAHEDDSIRGVLAALAICAKLHELGFKPAIGVTTGTAFCGVVGSHSRREYSVLGDTVNLAARLMQHATKLGGGVICDTATQYSARHRLHFEDLAQIQVKGKTKPVLIWQPYSRVLAPLYQSKEFLQQQAAEALAAQQALEPSSPSSTIAPIPILTEYTGSGSGNNSLSPTSAALLQNTSMVLVDDETLHLRRKSMTVDPMNLMRSVSATSPTAASASAAAALGSGSASKIPGPAPLDLGTSDTIDAAAVANLDRVAKNGGAVARAVDCNTAQELAREGEMIPASAAALASSSTAASTGSDLPDFTRYATALNASSGPGSGASSAAMLALPAANTPLDLMRQIHDFQMEGHRRSYMQERRLKRRGGAHGAGLHPPADGSSATSSAAASPAPSAVRRLPSGSARTNSMDAAVHTTSPTFASVAHANSLQLNLAADSAAAASAADALALVSNSSNVHLRWFSMPVCFDNISEGLAPSLEDVAAHFPSRLDSRRVRGVRVLLPDGLGCLYLSTAHLESILQLKEEISILCRKRLLLPLSASSQDYFLALEDDALWEAHHAALAEEAAAAAAGNDGAATAAQPEDEEFSIELDALNVNGSASIEDVLGPLVERQKAALTAYRAVHTHRPRGVGATSGVASSPVSLSQQLAGSLPASPTHTAGAGAAFSHPSSPASRLPFSSALDSPLQPLQSDLITLCLCAARPDYLVDVLPRKFHDIILHALEVRLLRERRGGTILLEGSVGLGKTHLMQGALAAAQRNHGPEAFTVLNSVANPFEMNKPLSAWRDIFLTAIDLEIERQPRTSSGKSAQQSESASSNGVQRPSSQSRLRAQRRSFLESKLKLRRSFGRDGLDLLAPVLNEVLQLDFPETFLTRGLDAHARTMHAQNLLVILMQLFTGGHSNLSSGGSMGGLNSTASTPRHRASSGTHLSGHSGGNGSNGVSSGPCIVVCIDDAVFLDIQSWALVLRMSREVPGLLLILATRPMNKTYQAAFVTSGVPADFVALRSEPQTTVLTLKSRTDQVIIQIAQEAFADQNMPAATAGSTALMPSHKHDPSRSLTDGSSLLASPSSSSAASASGLSINLAPGFAMINCPPSGRVLPELPQGLVNLLLKKAHGSPLVVLELVYNLKKSQLCTVEWIDHGANGGDGSAAQSGPLSSPSPSAISLSAIVRIDPRFNVSLIHNNPLIPVPITLQNILGCRIDRLTHAQRMILKCGAIVGDRFEFRIIEKIYPLATSEDVELRKEMQGLIELNILKEVIIKRSSNGANGAAANGVAGSPSHSKSRLTADAGGALAPTLLRSSASGSSLSMLLPSPVGGGSSSLDSDSHFPSVKYSWTDGFMREMFLSRMLDNQKSALDEKVSEARLELFKKRSERVLKMLLSPKSSTIVTPLNPILSSVLYVRETAVVKKTRSVHDDADDASSKSKGDASGSPSTLASPQPPALEYHLRYFVLTDGLLIGWVTEDAFLSARDPVCIYSLEDAATCENTTASFSFPNPAPPGLDPQLAFVIRSAVVMDRFSVYTHHAPTLVYLAALNEKEYEEWGVRLHEQITEKLVLPPVGAAMGGTGSPESASQTSGAGGTMQGSPSQTAEDADASGVPNAALNSASGLSGLHSQRASVNLQPNPLHATSAAGSSSSSGGGGGVTSHTPPNNNSPHTSFSIPATPGGSGLGGGSSSMFSQPQDVSTLSAADRESLAAKFVSAVENRNAPQIMPPALMSVRKHRAPTASDSKDKTDKGSVFGSEWKQRYVTLIDEALLLRDKKVGAGYKWTRPTQAFALGVGSPSAFLAPRAADIYDPIKKLYKITVEADMWMKGGVVSWSRRSVILGCATMDQARQLSDQIRQVIFKNQVANTQLQKQKHSRASTWGNFKGGATGGQQQGGGAGRKNEAGGATASSPAVTPGSARGMLNGANGPPNTPGRGMTRASFSTTTTSPSPQHHPRALNKSHSHAHVNFGAEDSDRKLRASQRQINGGMSIVTNSNIPPTPVSSGNAAPPPTPSAAGVLSPSVPTPTHLPSDQLVMESGGSAHRPPVHHLSAPAAAGHSPMTSPTQTAQLYPGSPLGGLGSPLYPTSPSPTAGSASHSRGVGSGEEFSAGMASPSPPAAAGALADEERQIDVLFNEAMMNLDSSSNGSGLASPGVASPVLSQSDQLKSLLLHLRHKVKAVTRASRARARLAGNVGDSPQSSPARADAGLAQSSGAAAASSAEDVDDADSNVGFTEMVSAADIDDTTRSWLQLNYSKPEEIAGAAAAQEAEDASSDSLPQTTPASGAVTVSVTTPSSPRTRGSKIILLYSPAGIVVDVHDLGSWEWCIFDVAPNDGSELLPVVSAIFGYFDFCALYSIAPATFGAWMHQVFCEYFDNPYHNFYHAVDTLQTTFALLTSQRGGTYLTQLEKFALLIAALCHDLRHPGLNNLFHISARTPLALLYNDQSILEHHHSASAFRILERAECNLLAHLSLNEYKHVRARITLGILATCMTDHFEGIQKFNTFLAEQAKLPANVAQAQAASNFLSVSPTSAAASSAAAAAANWTPVFQPAAELSDSTRGVIFNSFLHAADISNQTKPWRTQRQWSDAVLTEFLNQGDMERAKGLPVSPNCDRGHTDQALLSLNFVDFIVAPLFLSLRNLLPSLQSACLQMKDNRVEWSRLFVQSVQANSNLSEAEKAAEIARATRRMESFAEIMLPQDEAFRRLSSNAEEPNGGGGTTAAAATSSTATTVGTSSSGKRASIGPASNPAVAAASSSSSSATAAPTAASPAAASSPVSSGASDVSSASAPASSSAGSAPRRAHPLNDPRRNSMLMLRKFVSANSKASTKPRYHTLGPGAFTMAQLADKTNETAAPANNQPSAPAPLIRHYSVTSVNAAAALTEHRP